MIGSSGPSRVRRRHAQHRPSGEIESYKPYLAWHVLNLKPALIGEDPTNVERIMRLIRPRGGFKPWGSAVSAIEVWDRPGMGVELDVAAATMHLSEDDRDFFD